MKGESRMSQNNIKIRVSVGKFYDDISKNKKKTKVDSKALSMSLGYDEDIINEFPDEINMGLSCGNPINHLKIKEGQTLIDLGCGAGMDIFVTKMKNPKVGTLYGLDRLDSMLEKARKVVESKKKKELKNKNNKIHITYIKAMGYCQRGTFCLCK